MKKRISGLLLVVCIALSMLPVAFASGSTIYVSSTGNDSNNGDTTATAVKTIDRALALVSSGDTICILDSADSAQPGTNIPLYIEHSVKITGGTLSLNYSGIVLGADVTFDGVELAFANRVRNAIMANGYRLTLKDTTKSDTVMNTVHLFCGGLTGYAGFSEDAGSSGEIIIQGSTALGNIYAGSISADGVANEWSKPSVITFGSSFTGSSGQIFACGAMEAPVDEGEMINPEYETPQPGVSAANYPATGGVTINLTNKTVAVDGATSETSCATVNYVAASNNPAVHTLTNIGALTLSGTDPILMPTAGSSIASNASVSVPDGARLDLTNFTNTTDQDSLTIGSFSGGGTLVLGSDQTLTITGAVTGTTAVELSTAGDCITAENSTEGSFEIAGSFMELTRGDDGVWTAEWLSIPVTDFAVTGASVSTAERTANLPVSVTYADEAGNWDWDFVTIEFTIAVNGNTAEYDDDAYAYVDPVTGLSLYPSTEEETFVVEHETGFSKGSYTITITVPVESTMGGEAITREAELTVTQAACSSHSGGTATCNTLAVCETCGEEYGEVDTTNHTSTTYTNGFRDCCGEYEAAIDYDNDGYYEIANAGQLYWFAAQVNSGNTCINAKLTANIVVNEGAMTADSTNVREWTPIGNSSNKYIGTFDGAGHTISGLYFNDSTVNYVGLFGYVQGTVKNVGVIDSYLSGKSYVGGMVGYNSNGTIESCYNTGSVSGSDDYVGGVVGYKRGGTIESCYNTGSVSGSDDYVGGVVGNNVSGTIESCYNTGAVVCSSDYVGGVAGYNYGTITGCSNTGVVIGEDMCVGGIVGKSEGNNAKVTNCYNEGSISGIDSNIGGIVGSQYQGVIANCCNTGTVRGSFRSVGGVVGSASYGSVENCYNSGTVIAGDLYAGGVAAYNSGTGTIRNCYSTGAVSGKSYVGGVVGENGSNGVVSDCYFDSTVYSGAAVGDNSGKATNVMGKITAQFASGEVAYLLGDAFGQTIGTDATPNFTGDTVYRVSNCKDEVVYSNTNENIGHQFTDGKCTVCEFKCSHEGYDANGFCTVCDAYQSASLVDGYYEIANVGQLYWFAEQVNSGSTNINAILTANIEVNENVLTATGELNGDGSNFCQWTPIGTSEYPYMGTFDGAGHTVSGLYFNDSTVNYVGLFGYVDSVGGVKNVTVGHFYIGGGNCVGGVVGRNDGAVENCHSMGVVVGKDEVGSVVGINVGGIVSDCSAGGKATGSSAVGGVVGTNNTGSVENCVNTGTVNGEFSVGGVVGCNTKEGGISVVCNCVNTGTVAGESSVGGVVGWNRAAVTSCYNMCAIYGYGFVGGVVGDNDKEVTNCYNTGSVSGGNYVGGVAGDNEGTVTNCCYLSGTASSGGVECSAEEKTLDQFASGEVAYLLGDAFGQTIGTDEYPVFRNESGSNKVYKNQAGGCSEETYTYEYSNTEKEPVTTHGATTYTNGFRDCCGEYQPATDDNGDGVYEIANVGQLYWFAEQVTGGNTAINAILTDNIAVNEGTMTADSTNAREWTPIGNFDNQYTGIFDGVGYTIEGLYFNESRTSYVGLFGYVGEGGAVMNTGVVNSYIGGKEKVGGVVGCNSGTVTGCYNTGEVYGGDDVGGVVGRSNGTVTNCYNTGTVAGESAVGGVVGTNREGGVTNCYYLDGCGAEGDGTSKTTEQFASGEVAYLLGDPFGQTIGTDNSPVLGGATVYYGYVSCSENAEQVYTNVSTATTEKPAHTPGTCSDNGDGTHSFTCTVCSVTITEAHTAGNYSADANVITDSCACGATMGTATITADDAIYAAAAQETAMVAYSDGWTGGELTVTYESNTNAGTATASITIGGATASVTFEITRATVTVTADAQTKTYGDADPELTYEVSGLFGEDALTGTLSRDSGEDVGTYAIKQGTLTAGDNYTVSYTGADLTITAKPVTPTVEGVDASYTYTGETIRPTIIVKDGETVLTEGTDYDVSYGENLTVADGGSVTVTLKGNYSGTKIVDFAIAARTVALPVFVGLDAQYLHTGSAIEPAFTLKDDLGNVIDANEYTVAYSSNTDIGTATITVTDKDGGNYTVSGTATFDIATHSHVWVYTADGAVITATCEGTFGTCAVGTATVTLVAPENLVYDGSAKTVTISDSIDGVTLPEIQYTGNCTDAGTHTVALTLGTATATLEFTITRADAVCVAPEAKTGLIYNGSAQALITAGSTQHGTMHYSLDNASWSAEIPTAANAGEYTVYYKVVGDSNHNDTAPASVTVTIGQMDLSGAAVTLATALTYNGTAQTQSIASVTLNGLTLTAGDYTVTGNQQTDAGDYTLTLTGKGNFTGTVTADWSIARASMTITADNVTVLVGKTAPDVSALTYTVTGLVNGETAEDALTKKPTLSYASTPDTTQEGSYTINISGADATNYTIAYVTGTLTVSEKTAVTITVNVPANLVYDGTDQSDRIKANITAADTATGEAVTVAGYEYEFSADPINAGSYALTVSVADSDEQYVGSVNVSFTIAKRSLTLKADNKSAYVNNSEPEYTFTVTGLVTGHSASGVVVDCADADMTRAGTYDITISTVGLVIKNGETDVTANYAVTTEKGTLTVREYSIPVIPTPTPTPDPEPEETVTVPVTDEENTVEVEVTVTEGKATVEDVDLTDLEKVVDGDSGTVTIDFSELDEKITEVELPVEVVEKIAEAAGKSEQTLEILLSDGLSIEFNASALNEQVQRFGGTSLTVSIIPHEDAKLTHEQKTAVGDRPAYDISVTNDGKNISDMGGKITVTVPYELRNGEKGRGLVVYYVDDHGKRERCDTHYDAKNKRLSWQTDHLSLYMLDYDEKHVEACDGGEYCPINAFTDTDSKAWYHNGVHYCIENDLMNGVSDVLFAPNGTTTRAQIVTILWRLEGTPVVNYLMQFEDVASESWYTEAVRWAAAEGIVNGYSAEKFAPNDAITREQMAAILYRYCQYKGIDVSVGEDTNILSYTDAFSISEWAIPAMQWACGSGMIQGIADGTGMKLDPSGSATRAQIATILWRFCEAIVDN